MAYRPINNNITEALSEYTKNINLRHAIFNSAVLILTFPNLINYSPVRSPHIFQISRKTTRNFVRCPLTNKHKK